MRRRNAARKRVWIAKAGNFETSQKGSFLNAALKAMRRVPLPEPIFSKYLENIGV
jgi:hypothetical protein